MKIVYFSDPLNSVTSCYTWILGHYITLSTLGIMLANPSTTESTVNINSRLTLLLPPTSSHYTTMPYAIQDKNGNPIVEGDYVWTRYRGGSHQGQVRHLPVSVSPWPL